MSGRWTGICAALVLALGAAGGAGASTMFDLDAPIGPVTGDNLEFDNFEFHSIFGDVEAGDLSIRIDGDQVEISGPVSVINDHALFFVSYDAWALDGQVIEGVSLLLDSQTRGHFAFVGAKKKVFGERKGRHHFHGEKLAFLHTYDISKGRYQAARRGDREGFEGQEHVKVVDVVALGAWGRSQAVWRSSTNRFAVVPEPATAALLGMGLVGLAYAGRRRS